MGIGLPIRLPIVIKPLVKIANLADLNKSRHSQHRVTFQVGNFITVFDDQLARLDGVFLHELSPGRIRIFATIKLVIDLQRPRKDPVLETPLLIISDTDLIVGLPAIRAAHNYLLYVKTNSKVNPKRLSLEQGGTRLLLHWNHNIQFI